MIKAIKSKLPLVLGIVCFTSLVSAVLSAGKYYINESARKSRHQHIRVVSSEDDCSLLEVTHPQTKKKSTFLRCDVPIIAFDDKEMPR